MRVTGIALVSAVGGALLVPAVPHAADPAPEAKLETVTQSIPAGTPVRLDSSLSTGAIVRHLWDLDGDGSFETDTGPDAVAGALPIDAGPLTVGVQVVDDQGNRDEATLDLTIAPAAPVGSAPEVPDKSISKSSVPTVAEPAAPAAPAAGAADRTTSKADTPASPSAPTHQSQGSTAPRHRAPAQAAAAPSGEQLAGAPQMTATTGRTSGASAKRAAASVKAAASSSVTIKNFLFNPSSVSVHVGDTVKWTNQDSALHTATANDRSFDTGTLKQGKSGSHKFTKAGSIAYTCSLHPNMKGTVVVAAASGGSGSGSGSGSDSTSSTKSTSKSSSLPLTGFSIAAVVALAALLTGSGTLLRRRVERRP
jgi:plastocyanin